MSMSPSPPNTNDDNNGEYYSPNNSPSSPSGIFTVRRQDGDGNCLFRSFSDQLYGTPDYHGLIRDRCSKYIASEKNYFVRFVDEPFDDFLQRIQREGEWGDD